MSRLLFQLTNLVFPPHCWTCSVSLEALSGPYCLCSTCHKDIVEDATPSCPRCASTIGPHTESADGCTRCRDHRFHFEGVLRLGPYEGRLRDAILLSKSLSHEPLAEILGSLFAEKFHDRLKSEGWQRVVPVPLYWWRRWERGYNQAESIARGIATGLALPLSGRELLRVRNTPMQTTRSPTQRHENVRGAFLARNKSLVQGLRILLVDDVLTTGATADEAARVLREAGAAQVQVAVLAHR